MPGAQEHQASYFISSIITLGWAHTALLLPRPASVRATATATGFLRRLMPVDTGDTNALAAALALLVLIRVARAWNQSGVKHAGSADVVPRRSPSTSRACMVCAGCCVLYALCCMRHGAHCWHACRMFHAAPFTPMARLLPSYRRTGTCLPSPVPSPFQASWIAGCESAWARAAPPVLALAIIALVGTRAWVDAWLCALTVRCLQVRMRAPVCVPYVPLQVRHGWSRLHRQRRGRGAAHVQQQ